MRQFLTCLLRKSIICGLLPILPLMAASLADFPSIPSERQNVCLSDTLGIMPIPEATIVFTDDFKGSLADKWTKPLNHANLVVFKTGLVDGKQSMVWINEKKEDIDYNTETAIGSKPFSVKDVFELHLDYAAKSTVGVVLRKNIIHYEDYDFKLCWYKEGETKPFKEDAFDCETSPEKFVENSHVFVVPEGAATATLHYGFGKPNFQKGQLFAVTDLVMKGYGKTGRVSKAASFVTAPLRLTGRQFSFDGNVPNGTSIRFSFAYAPDDGGAPGAWSAWSAPMAGAGTLAPTPNAVWAKCKVDFTSDGTAAASVKSLTIGERVVGNWSSIILPKRPEVFIASPTPARADAPVQFRIDAGADINWKESQLIMDGKNANGLFKAKASLPDGVLEYVPEKPLAAGVHDILFKLKTIDGATLEKVRVFFVGPERTDSPQVTMRHDGMMLVDGKPFFPIGLYYLKRFYGNNNSYDTMFKDLKSRGFNFGREAGCFDNAKDAREFALAAERNDFHIMTTAGFDGKLGANTHDIRTVAEGIAALRDIKSILMWYIGDDTHDHNTPDIFSNKRDTAKAIDPGRVVVQADIVGSVLDSCYRPFVNCTEVFHPEIYPIYIKDAPRKHAECVFKTIADMDCAMKDVKEVATAPKSIQALLQFFENKNGNPNGWVYPTAIEVRAMTYASIIRGATGVMYYCYGAATKYNTAASIPERWEELSVVSRELESLYDILTAEPVAQPAAPVIVKGNAKDKNGRVPVYALVKRSDKRTVLFTVNASVDDVTAQITVPGVTAAKELFPTKDFKLAAPDVLEIPFTRHQVRVFELTK